MRRAKRLSQSGWKFLLRSTWENRRGLIESFALDGFLGCPAARMMEKKKPRREGMRVSALRILGTEDFLLFGDGSFGVGKGGSEGNGMGGWME